MTTVGTRREVKVLLTLIVLYSGVYSFIGAAFVHNIYRSSPRIVDIILGVVIFLFSAIYSYSLFHQWYSCSVESRLGNNYFHNFVFILICSVVFLSLIWILSGTLRWTTVVLCFIRALVYGALIVSFDYATKNPEIDCSARRVRIMIPWIYGMMEPTMFGSSIMLSFFGGTASFVTYAIPILYFIIWLLSLKGRERDVKLINGTICIIVVGLIILFYYLLLISSKSTDNISYTATIKSLALSVCGAGIFGIPGIVEIAQILRRDGERRDDIEVMKDKYTYKKIMEIISIIDLCSIILVHFAFTYLDIPMIYFVLYAVLSVFWVLIARRHYEEKQYAPYEGSYILSVLYPLLPSICLLCCIYDVIPRPHQALILSPQIALWSAGAHFSIDFLAVIAFGVKLNVKEIVGNFWRIRLVGYRTLGMFLSEIFLLFTLALQLGNNRTSVMMVLLTAELIIQVLGYVLFYSNKRFDEKQRQ